MAIESFHLRCNKWFFKLYYSQCYKTSNSPNCNTILPISWKLIFSPDLVVKVTKPKCDMRRAIAATMQVIDTPFLVLENLRCSWNPARCLSSSANLIPLQFSLTMGTFTNPFFYFIITYWTIRFSECGYYGISDSA
jgi:hypothetical protein